MSKERGGNSASLATAVTAVAATASAFLLYRVYQRRRRDSAIPPLEGVLQCQCGLVQIQVNAAAPNHILCYCDDCQNYETYCRQQRKLIKGANAQDFRRVADKHGGVRVCQVYKSDIKVARGMDHLKLTVLDPKRLSEDRPFQMMRVHTDCCGSPMISAFWRDLPVVGVFISNLQLHVDKEQPFCMASKIADDPESFDWDKDDIPGLPEVRWRINEKYAKQPELLRPGGSEKFSPLFIFSFLWRNFVVGRNKKEPCPFILPPVGKEVVRYQ